MKYVEKVQVLLVDEENPENTTVKTYAGKECCAVFWGPVGRTFYTLSIERSGLAIEDKKKRYDKLNKIDSEAIVNQEVLVFGKTTDCDPL